MCGVERVCKGEPSAKCLVIGRVNVDIVCLERCSENKIFRFNELSRFVRTTKMLTSEIILLWHVILRREWDFEVVHKDESVSHDQLKN